MSPVFLAGLALALGPFGGFSPTSIATHPPPAPGREAAPLPVSPCRTQVPPADTTGIRWILIPEQSEARYRVTEQLAGFDFPNDAVGATREVTGTLVLGADGAIVAGESEFRVQVGSLTTDNERRDRYVRGRTLEADQYPEAVLKPRRFLDLPAPLPRSGEVSFSLEADLTLHGQTRSTVWEVSAEFGSSTVTGLATTSFPFSTFGLSIPQVARVLSVEDNIRLELEFRVVKEESLLGSPPPCLSESLNRGPNP
jgi:polyisoprenoid-binding protein YceI